jgi:hypothetical protein
LALTFFVGVALVFAEGWEQWELYFTERAILFVLPPYVLLVAHLMLRNHVGRYLLNRGAYEEAVEYGRKRARGSLFRSRRELANQRLVWARGLVGLGRYGEAAELLEGRIEGLPGGYGREARRWLMELALREDDREKARALLEASDEGKGVGGRTGAVLRGCEAELALRDSDLGLYQEKMRAALWGGSAHPRVGLSRVLAMVGREDGEYDEESLFTLELLRDSVSREIPAREAEIDGLRAWVLHRLGRGEEAEDLLSVARSKPTDPWTDHVLAQVEQRVGEG